MLLVDKGFCTLDDITEVVLKGGDNGHEEHHEEIVEKIEGPRKKEPIDYSEQDTEKFQSILTIKVDGYPWIRKGGFDRSKMQEIAAQVRKVPGVISFNVNPDNISTL